MGAARGFYSPKQQRGVTARFVANGVEWEVSGAYRPVKRDVLLEMAWRVSDPDEVYGPDRLRLLGLHTIALESLRREADRLYPRRTG